MRMDLVYLRNGRSTDEMRPVVYGMPKAARGYERLPWEHLEFGCRAVPVACEGPQYELSLSGHRIISLMKPNGNFSLGAGVWTDDTSMMLALARPSGTYSGSARGSSSQQAEGTRGGFDEADQLEAYLRWYQDGVLSAIGRCFDIGSTIRHALGIYKDALKASGALSPAETRRLLPAAKEKEKEKRRTTAKSALARIARDLRGDGFGGNGSHARAACGVGVLPRPRGGGGVCAEVERDDAPECGVRGGVCRVDGVYRETGAQR
ncbi:hypothetical protein B0H14DRAFT_2622283 [Mycena olivaceomarginata]|nr:hypothetical protein B0H14DRAFT_2622283 [Mycena olivaceomarginata]